MHVLWDWFRGSGFSREDVKREYLPRRDSRALSPLSILATSNSGHVALVP